MNPKELRIRMDGRPVPQGRPRFSVRGKGKKQFVQVYYSATSTAYREALVKAVKAAVEGEGWKPCKRSIVNIYPCGMRKGSDCDNMAKQVMDALVTGGALPKDDWEHVPMVLCSARAATTWNGAGAPHVLIYVTECAV